MGFDAVLRRMPIVGPGRLGRVVFLHARVSGCKVGERGGAVAHPPTPPPPAADVHSWFGQTCNFPSPSHKVHRHFESEVTTALEGVQGAASLQESAAASRVRQRAWLKRGRGEKSSWKPRKRCRVSAWRYLASLDWQLQLAGIPGLKYLRQPEAIAERGPASQWPKATLSLDLGSDGVAAANYAQRVLKLNIDLAPDASHLAHRSLVQSFKESGLWVFVQTAMLTFNCPHGPWYDDLRYQQVREAMSGLFRTEAASSCPLFVALADSIAFDQKDNPNLPDLELESLWEFVKGSRIFEVKGTKSNCNRFMSMLIQGKSEIDKWGAKQFAYNYACLEMGFFATAKFQKVVLREKAGDGVGYGSTGVSTKAADKAEQALRGACQNQLVVSAMFLGEPLNKKLWRGLVLAGAPLQQWHSEQNTCLRAVGPALKWSRQQQDGGILEVCAEIVECLQSEVFLANIPFSLPRVRHASYKWDELEVAEEDELACTLSQFVFRLAANFMLRFLWLLRGWPASSLRWLGADSESWLRTFRNDHKIFQLCCSQQARIPGLRRVLTRSPFRLVLVEQLFVMLTAAGWVLTDQIRQFVEDSGRRLQATQAVEDAFNRQKNVGGTSYSFRYKAPEKSFHTLVSRNVLQQVHDFQEVRPSQDLATTQARVPPDAFRPSRSKSSLDLWGIVGTGAPHWWSPSAGHWHTQWADLLMLRDLVALQQLHMVENVWLGGLVDAAHPFVLRRKRPSAGPWYFGLHHIHDSCCLVYEAVEVESVGAPCFVPRMADRQLQTITIVDLSDWEAISVTWRSPLGQWAKFKQARQNDLPSAVRAVADGVVAPLLECCAAKAFYNIKVEFLKKLCGHLGVVVESGASLFDVVMALEKHIFEGKAEEELLAIVEQRVKYMRPDNTNMCQVLEELDEGIGIFERQDAEEMETERKRLQVSKQAADDFVEKMCGRKRRLREAAAAASASQSGAAQRSKKRGASTPAPKHKPLPVGNIEHGEANALKPPGSSIWRGLKRGSWAGHFPPEPRCSFSWNLYGERRACILVLQTLWAQYCAHTGTPREDVPIQGLWDDPSQVDLPTGSCSASSGTQPKARQGK